MHKCKLESNWLGCNTVKKGLRITTDHDLNMSKHYATVAKKIKLIALCGVLTVASCANHKK